MSHGYTNHGSDAVRVRECFDKFGSIHMFFNPRTDRYAELCFMDDGKYGIRILEEGREITVFVKNKLKRLEQVLKYLENKGYTNQVK
jgi:hypothetical protein